MIRLPMLDGVGTRTAISLDFVNSKYSLGPSHYTTPSALPGWSFTRASTGYALNSGGVLVPFGSGVPRITDLGLLVEPSTTNLLLWSQTVDNAAWFKNLATIAADSAIAPDGTQTADVVTWTGAAGNNQTFSQAATTVSGSVYTFSIWAKGSGTVQMDAPEATGSAQNIVLSSSWQRFSGVFTAGFTSQSFRIISAPGKTATGVTVWGAQAEPGSSASSDILTTSTTVTRAADAVTVAYSPAGSAATVSYGTNSTASVSPTSPINLGSSSGGAWVGNYVRSLVVTP